MTRKKKPEGEPPPEKPEGEGPETLPVEAAVDAALEAAATKEPPVENEEARKPGDVLEAAVSPDAVAPVETPHETPTVVTPPEAPPPLEKQPEIAAPVPASVPAGVDWETHLRPHVLPSPTYMPAVVALGLVLLMWGIITSLIILFAGLFLVVVGIRGWIGDLRHESEQPVGHTHS